MGKNKKKGKYAGKRKRDNSWLWWLLLIPAWVLFLFLEESPALQPMRDSGAYRFFWKALISGWILYIAFFSKKKQPLAVKLVLTAAACTYCLTTLGLSERFLLLTELLIVYISIGVLLYLNIKKRKSSTPLLLVAAFFSVVILEAFGRYTYIDPSAEMRSWPVYLACGIVAAAVIGYLTFHGILRLEDDRTFEKVALCLVAAFIGFLLPWQTRHHVNYIFDHSEPSVYELTVGEKDLQTSSKSGTDYYLIVGRNGQELKMEVSQSEYYQFEVGDKLPVALYEGTLGDAYYIVE